MKLRECEQQKAALSQEVYKLKREIKGKEDNISK